MRAIELFGLLGLFLVREVVAENAVELRPKLIVTFLELIDFLSDLEFF